MLVGLSIATVTLDISLVVFKKLNIHLQYDPVISTIPLLGIYKREVRTQVHTGLVNKCL